MEVQILRYYLGIFSFLIFIFFLYYIFFIQTFFIKKNEILISKGDSISIINKNISSDKNILLFNINQTILKISNQLYSNINYGKFFIESNTNFLSLIKTISNTSNIEYEIKIIEGWEYYQLEDYLSNYYNDIYKLPYETILADTYYINSSNSLLELHKFLTDIKNNFFNKYSSNHFFKLYGKEKIMIISSLVEKEGKNNEDKSLIASVIFNRLKLGMKLQIDATVIYSFTEGNKKFQRSLTYEDLKNMHPYNTYYIKGLPPNMISYVGPKTVELVLESPKSDFLFYFYNILENKHIFSKNYSEHINKLNEYRSN